MDLLIKQFKSELLNMEKFAIYSSNMNAECNFIFACPLWRSFRCLLIIFQFVFFYPNVHFKKKHYVYYHNYCWYCRSDAILLENEFINIYMISLIAYPWSNWTFQRGQLIINQLFHSLRIFQELFFCGFGEDRDENSCRFTLVIMGKRCKMDVTSLWKWNYL